MIWIWLRHCNDIIMTAMASQITSLTIVNSTVYSRRRSKKYQTSVSLAFVRGNSPVNGEFLAQRASNAVNVSIYWRRHENVLLACYKSPAEGCVIWLRAMGCIPSAVFLILTKSHWQEAPMKTISLLTLLSPFYRRSMALPKICSQ